LPLPTVKQQIVKLIDVHLDDDVDLRVIVGLDTGNAIVGADEGADALLHPSKEFLRLEQEALAVVSLSNGGSEHELPKIDIHEQLCQQGVEVASVG
jgi:hypothetical protein